MKRFVSMLLASVMTFSTFGMVAFADDGPQSTSDGSKVKVQSVDESQESNSWNVEKWNLHLDKSEFEYLPSDYYKKFYGTHKEFSTMANILKHIKYTSPDEDTVDNDADFLSYNTIITVDNKVMDEDSIINAGKHKLVIEGDKEVETTGRVEIPFEVQPFKMDAKSTGVFDIKYLTYNGKKQYPKFHDKYGTDVALKCPGMGKYDGEFLGNKDCTITYKNYKNNKNVGVGSVTLIIQFKGNYTGTVTKTKSFVISPKNTKISKIKRDKKSATIKWKRRKDVSGYRIEIVNSNGKTIKSCTIKSNKKTSLKVKGLKRHKKYFTWMRTYKTVKGKKIYSFGGKIKTFRTK